MRKRRSVGKRERDGQRRRKRDGAAQTRPRHDQRMLPIRRGMIRGRGRRRVLAQYRQSDAHHDDDGVDEDCGTDDELPRVVPKRCARDIVQLQAHD